MKEFLKTKVLSLICQGAKRLSCDFQSVLFFPLPGRWKWKTGVCWELWFILLWDHSCSINSLTPSELCNLIMWNISNKQQNHDTFIQYDLLLEQEECCRSCISLLTTVIKSSYFLIRTINITELDKINFAFLTAVTLVVYSHLVVCCPNFRCSFFISCLWLTKLLSCSKIPVIRLQWLNLHLILLIFSPLLLLPIPRWYSSSFLTTQPSLALSMPPTFIIKLSLA